MGLPSDVGGVHGWPSPAQVEGNMGLHEGGRTGRGGVMRSGEPLS